MTGRYLSRAGRVFSGRLHQKKSKSPMRYEQKTRYLDSPNLSRCENRLLKNRELGRGFLCHVAVIEGQQTAQAFVLYDWSIVFPNLVVRKGDDVVEALVISFGMVVGEVFPKDVSKLLIAEEDHLVEALTFAGFHPALRERVQVRTFGRQLDDLGASACKERIEGRGVLCIPVMDQVLRLLQLPVPTGEVAGYLLHPFAIRLRRHTAKDHSPCAEMDKDGR